MFLNESGYSLDLELLTISNKSDGLYPRRSGLVKKSNLVRPV